MHGKMKGAHKNLVGKTDKESSLEIHRHRFKDNIKTVLKEIGCECGD
jgi:hypothetical protein